jgi:putative ABC transport system permease protein
MNAALSRFSRRQMRTRPGRALLTLMSIVLGVAAISSVEMLAVSIRNASQNLFATVTGRAALVIQNGNQPIDQSLVDVVDKVDGVEAAVPVIQFNASISTRNEETSTRTRGMAMGVDPARDSALRDHVIVSGSFFDDAQPAVDPETGEEDDRRQVVLEESFARARDLKVGDEVKLTGAKRAGFPLRIVGLVKSTSYARATAGGLAMIKLSDAQASMYGGKKKVTAIQIVLKSGVDEADVAKRINAALPPGVVAEEPRGRTAVLEQTMHPTEQGLSIAVVFVTLLAAFIVFNTFMMNVSERRRQMAILRAIGGTRSQLFGTLITEALVLGLIGTLLGIFLGWRGTVWTTYVLGHVLEVDFPIAQLTWRVAVEGGAFGIGIALVGAIVPAWQASKLTPLEAMSPLARQDGERQGSILIVVGILLVGVGGCLLYMTMRGYVPVTWGVYPALLQLLGLVTLFEATLVEPVSHFLGKLLHPFFGPPATLARRQIVRHQTRSALTAGVLFIAAATGIGLSYVILDTVTNVRDWYKRTIIGDFYIRVALPDFATGESPETPEEFDERLNEYDPAWLRSQIAAHAGDADKVAALTQKLEDTGVQSVDRARIVDARIRKAGSGEGVETKLGARQYPTPVHAQFDFLPGEGDPETIYQQLTTLDPQTGLPRAVVSSVVATQLDLHVGDVAELQTAEGWQKFLVAGVNNEYLVGGLMVWMHRPNAEKLLGISGYDGYIVMVKPGHEAQVRRQIEPLTKEYGLLFQSFAEIHKTIDGIIRSSDFMLWALVFVEFVVASFGMVNTLTMSVLEQTRELGMLRIIAMTREQVRRTIEAQAIIIGLMGIVPGMAVGLVIAYLMNIATFASIAHPVKFGFHPWMVLGTLAGAMALVVVAALLPAYRASRIDVLKALQYE